MSKRDKLRRKLRNNPRGVRFSELETLLLRFGFQLVRIKGSHHFYHYQQGDIDAIMVVPVHGNEVKVQYVKDAVALLDELFPEVEPRGDQEEQDDDGE
ncbi:MAG: type II toxin-antitoxin system HicA family toxin [Anaerolineae bacterium]|nr:type II toxin-antitoxin system HicA family toxin [Anaerolineae bacterium]